MRPALPPKTGAAVERDAADQFLAVTDVVRAAARIPQDRSLSPETLRARCAYGLERIFGTA